MRIRLLCALALVLASSFYPAQSQTISDLKAKYGEPNNPYSPIFSVSQNIWMLPKFTDEGQICMADLFPKRAGADDNYLFTMLPLQEVKEVFDWLAPTSVRGKENERAGPGVWDDLVMASISYENILINFVSAAGPQANQGKERQVGEAPGFPGLQPAHIVRITWLNRKCARL